MEEEGTVKHSKRIKIGAGVGALVLAIATPVALAQAGDDGVDDPDSGVEGLICFEVEDQFTGSFGFEGDWPFEGDFSFEGDFPFEGGFPFEGTPGEEFGFEGGWFLGLEESEFPPGLEFEGQPLPAMDEMLDLLNEESLALAEYLEDAGIEHEVITGPMGVIWVEWDFSDRAANEAVEEFIVESGGLIDMALEILPFDDLPFDIPFDIDGIPFAFDDLPFGMEGFPFGDDGMPLDIEGLGGFFDGSAWHSGDGFPGFPGEMGWGGEFFDEMMSDGPFGPGMVCVETIGTQADRISDEAAGLAEALAAAGIDVTIETRQITVPIWDTDDEAAREVVEQYYADLLGLSRVSGDGS